MAWDLGITMQQALSWLVIGYNLFKAAIIVSVAVAGIAIIIRIFVGDVNMGGGDN